MEEDYYCNHCHQIRNFFCRCGLCLTLTVYIEDTIILHDKNSNCIEQPHPPHLECIDDSIHYNDYADITISGMNNEYTEQSPNNVVSFGPSEDDPNRYTVFIGLQPSRGSASANINNV